MLFILLAFLGLSLAFFGLGQLLWWGLRWTTRLPIGQPLWGELGLLGLFAFGIAAVLWNFALPITSAFAWPMLGLGFAVQMVALIRTVSLRRSLLAIAVPALIAAGALSVLVAFTPLGYDAGLYHLPAQLWTRSGPTVLGLSHFHNRFGLNSMLEPISAALWLHGNLILVGVADALFPFFYLLSIMQFLRGETSREMPVSVAFAVLSPLSLLLFNRTFLFSVGVDDVPAAMLTLTCLFAFVRGQESREDIGVSTPLTTLVLLAAFAVAVKLSSLAVAVLPAMALLLSIGKGVPNLRRWAATCLAGGALLLPLLARGALLSGCLMFPVASTCVERWSWSDRENADLTATVITSWARARETDPARTTGWAWLPGWSQRYRKSFARIGIVTLVVSAVAWGWRSALRRIGSAAADDERPAGRGAALGGVVLFGVASLALWFVRGPDPRFGAAALHVLTIAPALLILGRSVRPLAPRAWRVAGATGIALALLFSLDIAAFSWPLTADRADLLYSRLGTPTVETVPNRHFGVRPAVGDQCWLSRSPCSPSDPQISVESRGRWLLIEPLSR